MCEFLECFFKFFPVIGRKHDWIKIKLDKKNRLSSIIGRKHNWTKIELDKKLIG